MKRTLCFILIILVLSSCSDSEIDHDRIEKDVTKVSDNQNVSEVKEGGFVLQIVSEKAAYKVNEEVKMRARLKYVGNEKKLKIFHAASPFLFGVFEVNRKIGIPSVMNQPLLSSELSRDEWLEETFTKTGGYSDDDPNINFLKDYLHNPGFPEGEYHIKVTADFFVEEGEEKVDYKFSTEEITVTVAN